MPGTMVVNAETVLSLAKQPAYNWMRSIETVRLLVRQPGGGCSACQSKLGAVQLNRNTYLKIAGSPGFRADLATIKAQQGLTSIQLAMDGVFETL